MVTGSLKRPWAANRPAKRSGRCRRRLPVEVGKDTDYLVVGANVGASKLAKAAKLGTKQISEDDLAEVLAG